MQKICIETDKYILINTLEANMQNCLIKNTVNIHEEESLINMLLNTSINKSIIIYGINCNDDKIFKKYEQLIKLGFTNVYIYVGGMFEWLLLQDIYGDDLFPTTTKTIDHLRYCGPRRIGIKAITQ